MRSCRDKGPRIAPSSESLPRPRGAGWRLRRDENPVGLEGGRRVLLFLDRLGDLGQVVPAGALLECREA
jgi:hypothetical protein